MKFYIIIAFDGLIKMVMIIIIIITCIIIPTVQIIHRWLTSE